MPENLVSLLGMWKPYYVNVCDYKKIHDVRKFHLPWNTVPQLRRQPGDAELKSMQETSIQMEMNES